MTYPHRKHLPPNRNSITHKVEVYAQDGQTHDVYITVGLFEDGSPGELFLTVGKVGSTMRGLLDTIGKQTSLLLQLGAPLRTVCDKLSYLQFEPAGKCFGAEKEPEGLRNCTSIVDYVFRWMAWMFEDQLDVGLEEENIDWREQAAINLQSFGEAMLHLEDHGCEPDCEWRSRRDVVRIYEKRSVIDRYFHHCQTCNGMSSFNQRLTSVGSLVWYCRWCGQPEGGAR